MLVLKPNDTLRRCATILAAALILGVAAHGVFQAIEHQDGAGDVAALCAAGAAVVVAAVCFGGRERQRARVPRPVWFAVPALVLVAPSLLDRRRSVAWLQRFQN